jgi:nitrogen fixation/metabolism regulation signal transduction histidine kinase
MVEFSLIGAVVGLFTIVLLYLYAASTGSFRQRYRTLFIVVDAIIIFGSAFVIIRLLGQLHRRLGAVSKETISCLLLSFAVVWAAGCFFLAGRFRRGSKR